MINDLVSIVIPTFNASAFLKGAIESALHQNYMPLEVIVIDDGSTDNTSDVVRDYGTQVIFYRQNNLGPSGTRNTGIKLSKGEFIAFLDADDTWEMDKLQKQMHLMKNDPDIGLVHTNVWSFYLDRNEKECKDVKREEFVGQCYARLFSENRILTSSVLVRRKCFNDVGLFDETLRVCEDWDMWIRLSRKYRFAYVPKPLVNYRIHKNNLTADSINMRKGDYSVLCKMLSDDPSLEKMIGNAIIKKRISELCFGIGYHYYSLGEMGESRKYFYRSFGGEIRLDSIMFMFVSMLPLKLISLLRWTKRVVV